MAFARRRNGRKGRMGLINRFRRAVRAGRSATVDPPVKTEATVAALVLGAGAGELAAATAWLRSMRAGRAVLITDATGVDRFQLPGLVTEFLPTGRGIGGPEGSDPARKLYVQRRLAILFAKWTVSRCAAIGPEAETLLAAVRARGWTASDLATPAKATTG